MYVHKYNNIFFALLATSFSHYGHQFFTKILKTFGYI